MENKKNERTWLALYLKTPKFIQNMREIGGFWRWIELQYMNLFKLPAKDGTRRAIKDWKTGKWIYTKGKIVEVINQETYIPKSSVFCKTPICANRFEFIFLDLDEFIVRNVKTSISSTFGNTLKFSLVRTIESKNYVADFIKIQNEKRKIKSGIILEIDPKGTNVYRTYLEELEIIKIELPNFDYSSDDIAEIKVTCTFKRITVDQDFSINFKEKPDNYEDYFIKEMLVDTEEGYKNSAIISGDIFAKTPKTMTLKVDIKKKTGIIKKSNKKRSNKKH